MVNPYRDRARLAADESLVGQEGAQRRQRAEKLRWPERIGAKFATGTLDRIAAVLAEKEVRLDFIRQAVERELKRREGAKPKKPRRR
jgi:hypothetical protein